MDNLSQIERELKLCELKSYEFNADHFDEMASPTDLLKEYEDFCKKDDKNLVLHEI